MLDIVAAWPLELLAFATFWEAFFGQKKHAFWVLIVGIILAAFIL